jgi:NAD(P)-dependent dehydrogenase (short-subunit alcohol dehydrogenase family)
MVEGDSVETLADAALERLLTVNVMAVFRLGRHAIPELRRNGGGVIVNTTSVHAFATMDRCAAYAASKGAIVALTRQMAIDLAPDGIRVVAVAPGSVDTPLTRAELARRGQTVQEAGFAADARSLGRVCRPQEIAEVVAWLASGAAGAVNGSTVIADAGLLASLV